MLIISFIYSHLDILLEDGEVFGMHSEVFVQDKRHKQHICELIASLFSKYCIGFSLLLLLYRYHLARLIIHPFFFWFDSCNHLGFLC
jgi:hypothetical protein